MLTYSHSGAVLANTPVQNDVEVVVAGVEGPPDDAHDGEDVHLQSDDRQLRKHMEAKLMPRPKSLLAEIRKGAFMEAAGMLSVMGGQSKIKT